MNTMSFKGYTARVEYDERDNIFVGRILGIRGIISFHGETVRELRSAFERAVKEYLVIAGTKAWPPRSPRRASSCCAFLPRCTAEHWSRRRLQARV